jgi:cardiolipin hydrolase
VTQSCRLVGWPLKIHCIFVCLKVVNIISIMDEIIAHLKQSISDEVFSKQEKKTLKELVAREILNSHQLKFLRSKIYELANERVTVENYKFILEWLKNANGALIVTPKEMSEVFFSPGESCRAAIIKQLSSAVSQLKICVFTISDDKITDAIVTAHKRGVDIKILTDNDKSLDMGSDVHLLSREGIPIRMDNTSNHMHHKFMVIDESTGLTGSYNWTQSAARFNHENILLTNDGTVVKSFLSEFDKLWAGMDEYR